MEIAQEKNMMLRLVSIGVASGLVGFIAVSSILQGNQNSQVPDFPAVMTADAAAVDYFLKINGIDGESTDDSHRGEIEILSNSWGMSNSGSFTAGGSGGAGKVSFSSIRLTSSVNKASMPFESVAT